MFFALALLLLFVVAIQTAHAYNKLVMVKHNVSTAWSNIDVLLKQRNDELPKLAHVVREYMRHERELLGKEPECGGRMDAQEPLLERLVRARESAVRAREERNPGAAGVAEAGVRACTRQIFALAERYPELKASELFGELSQRIAELETAITDRRTFYNDTVRINNETVEQFPENLIAGWFAFKRATSFRFEAVPQGT